MARVDEKDVAGRECRDRGVLHALGDPLDAKAIERGARLGIDAGQPGLKCAVTDRARHETGGMAAADLDDLGRAVLLTMA